MNQPTQQVHSAFDFGAPRIRQLGRQFTTDLKADKSANNGTHYGGLAYLLQSGLAGMEKKRLNDERDADMQARDEAQGVLTRTLVGEPALDAPLPEGISGPVRPALPGNLGDAAHALAGLEGNPYAGRMAIQLLMNQRAQEAEAQRAEDIYQRDRTDKLSDFEMQQQANRDNFLFEQDNTYRAPKERKIITGADGFQYYPDNGERVLPGVVAAPSITPAQQANNQEVVAARAKLRLMSEAAGYGTDIDAFARDASIETTQYGQANPQYNPIVADLYRTGANYTVGGDDGFNNFVGVGAPTSAPAFAEPAGPAQGVPLDAETVSDPSRLQVGQTYVTDGQSFVWDGAMFQPVH